MSNTPRKKKLIAALLLLPLWLPVLLYTGFEWFIDPFPNSIWALRVLNTKYLVHVRADLTIDGEPLVMERTFRCYKGARQVGDNIAATTSKNRLFIIYLADVCLAPVWELAKRLKLPTGAAEERINDARTMRLSANELMTPVVFEIQGGRKADQIDAYIAREKLREGYAGIRLTELEINTILPESGWSQLVDWNGYEWFGPPNSIRPPTKNYSQMYTAGFVIEVPEQKWGTLETRMYNGTDPEYIAKMQRQIDYLHKLTTDQTFPISNEVFSIFRLFQSQSFLVLFDSLSPIESAESRSDTRVRLSWALENMIPCLTFDSGLRYFCDTAKRGVISYRPWTIKLLGAGQPSLSDPVYVYNQTKIHPGTTNSAAYFDTKTTNVLVTGQRDGFMRR